MINETAHWTPLPWAFTLIMLSTLDESVASLTHELTTSIGDAQIDTAVYARLQIFVCVID